MPLRLSPAIGAAAALVFAAFAVTMAPVSGAGKTPAEEGVIKVKSAYSMHESIARVKEDIASKGIMFFLAVDQSKLAADAGIKLRPSTLLIFGNPGLGAQFMTSNPIAGLDWPVRLLLVEDESGVVWAAYTDFAYIARRHHIADREQAFVMASHVIASITSSIAAR